MVGDAVASFGILLLRMLIQFIQAQIKKSSSSSRQHHSPTGGVLSLAPTTTSHSRSGSNGESLNEEEDREEDDLIRRTKTKTLDPAPPSERVPMIWWGGGLILTIALCVVVLTFMFRDAGVLWWQVLVAALFALVIAVLAIRALGETDLNPTSGISKLTQLVFAAIAPGNIIMNILAGAIAEAAAMSAGDMSQDLKTGHLIGASPRAQFFAMGIGSCVGIFSSVAAFLLYQPLIGSEELQAPVATVWIVFAQGLSKGLPTGVLPYVILFFLVGISLSAVYNTFPPSSSRKWSAFIPSGVAIAIGMYTDPKYSILRWVGSLVLIAWQLADKTSKRKFYVAAASGLVLGHGIFSIIEALLSLGGITAGNVGSCAGCAGVEYFSCGGGCPSS